MSSITYKYEYGHWVVYKDGKFYGTADTKAEAMKDVEEDELSQNLQSSE